MIYKNTDDITKSLKHIMIDDGIKQKDLVDISGLSKQTISNFSAGRTKNIGLDTLKNIVDCLGYDLQIEFIKKSDKA